MKLIIEISENIYDTIMSDVMPDAGQMSAIITRIYQGKPYEERPQGEWIPVSERLPEGKIDPLTNDFELVLCSTVWEVVRPYKFGKPIGHSKAHFWSSGGGIMDDYVIAWKPMPEPYKEERVDGRRTPLQCGPQESPEAGDLY